MRVEGRGFRILVWLIENVGRSFIKRISASDNGNACISLGFRSDLIIAGRTLSKPVSAIDYACISLQFTPMTNEEFVDPYRSEVGKIYIHKWTHLSINPYVQPICAPIDRDHTVLQYKWDKTYSKLPSAALQYIS